MNFAHVVFMGDKHEPSAVGIVLDNEEAAGRIALAVAAETNGDAWVESLPVIRLEDARRVRVLRLRLPASNSFLSTHVTSLWSWQDPGPAKSNFTQGGDDPIEIEGTDFGAMLAMLEGELSNRAWTVKT